MLGKDHINISIAFILTFIIPLFFFNRLDLVYPLVLLIAVLIGSLIPDTDCGGKATIYYRFPIVDKFMKKVVGRSIIFIFNHLISKKKIKTEYDVKDEHRGIIHSPIGVLLSSLIIIIFLIVFALIFGLFNWKIILIIFIGLLIGQFLHLFQDSCTINGINWGFPFKQNELKGSIKTFNKEDKRPKYFAGMFYLLIILIVLGYSFNYLNEISLILIYLIILIYDTLALFLMFIFSKGKKIKKEITPVVREKSEKETYDDLKQEYGRIDEKKKDDLNSIKITKDPFIWRHGKSKLTPDLNTGIFNRPKNREKKPIVKKKEKEKKSQFNEMVDNLEKNRSKIIKEKEDAKPKIEKDGETIKLKFRNKTFLFDQEGYDLFEEDFDKPNYSIVIKEGYLSRENKQTGGVKAFHRWLMQKEIENFCMENNCKEDELQVHHLDLTTTNNKRENLKVMLIEDHHKLHIREKFNGSNEEFEEWYEKEHG
jgi:membrane-bound metal-dependent hydrolase YbcI (DUF457 family)